MKKAGTNLILALLAACLVANVNAADRRYYLVPSLSYIVADDGRQADDGLGLQLGLGRMLNERWNLEAVINTDKLDLATGSGEFDQLGLGVDGLFFLTRKPAFSPYFVGGLGALKTDVPADNSTNLMANLGLGFLSRLTDYGAALRIDARYRFDDDSNSVPTENNFNDWLINLGVYIPLGQAHAAPVMAALPVDGDNDGVLDSTDDCPATPSGTPVDRNGCALDGDQDGVIDASDRCPATPVGISVDQMGCALDSDGDGVRDDLDRCPGTPTGMPVDFSGCLSDSDHDGVVDNRDRCAHTPEGVHVDVHGCQLQNVITLKGVNFATSSAELTRDSFAVLDDVARTLIQNPDLQVEVSGYTDNRGRKSFNVRLSQRRAEAVMEYLIMRGVNRDHLTAIGYGPENPVMSNDTAAGRAANRRVELHIAE